jgi:hypothetical protein
MDRPGALIRKESRSDQTIVVTKQLDPNIAVIDYFDPATGLATGEEFCSDSPFSLVDIKRIASAYAPLSKWDFFGTSGHMADLMLRNDRSGRLWLRLSYGPGRHYKHVVTIMSSHGSPSTRN